MSPREIRVTIGPNPPSRLDKALARDVPDHAALSRSRIAALIADQAVSIAGQPVTSAKAKVAEGQDIVIVVADISETQIAAQDIPLNILHEDDQLIVLNKHAGMVVHPAPGTPDGTLVNALLAHCGDRLAGIGGERRPGIVHRIDKDTSGLLVVAKTDAAHHGLAAQFESHDVRRIYLGVCLGCPDRADPRLKGVRGVSFEPGNIVRVTSGLQRHRTDRQRQAVTFHGGRHAITRVQVAKKFGHPAAAALVRCQLETGRTHQIRVHMAHIGHGLIGDATYGGRRKLSARAIGQAGAAAASTFPRQALHAQTLGFVHPHTKAFMEFTAELPADLAALVDALR